LLYNTSQQERILFQLWYLKDPRHPQRVAVETSSKGSILIIESRKDSHPSSSIKRSGRFRPISFKKGDERYAHG